LFFLVLFSFHSFGQLVSVKSMEIDSNSFIHEEYEYLLRKNDTIKNGNYFLEMFQFNGAEEHDKNVSLLNLVYKNGLLDGAVSSKRMHFKLSDGNQTMNEYYLSNPIDGISYELSGSFKENKPIGEWTVVGKEIKNAKPTREFKVLSITFNNKGEYQKDFIYDSKKNRVKISGEFEKNNLLHGKWEYVYSDDVEKKINFMFDEGLITTIQYKNETIFKQNISIETFEEIDLDSTFYQFVKLNIKLSEKELTTKLEGVLDYVMLLNRSLNYLQFKNLEIGELIPKESEMSNPRVRYPVHPFKTNEEESIDKTRLRAEEVYNKIDSVLLSSTFSIYMLTDSILTRKHAALMVLKNHTEIIRDFSITLDNPVAKYIDREEYATFVKNNLKKTPFERKYEFEGTTGKVVIDLEKHHQSNDYSEEMINYLNALESSYQRVLKVVSARLAEVKVTGELLEIESKMGKLAADLENKVKLRLMVTFDNELDQNFQDAFIAFKNKILSTYSSFDENKKKNFGEDMYKCLERMDELISKTGTIKQRRLIIHSSYNKKEMNPVTYTTMDVILYERLYNAYIQQLLPWAIQELGNNPAYDCDRFVRKFNNILTIQQYMIDVLEGNPNNINRKLRSKDTVSDILRKLELQLQ
jgi:hypothetical protein